MARRAIGFVLFLCTCVCVVPVAKSNSCNGTECPELSTKALEKYCHFEDSFYCKADNKCIRTYEMCDSVDHCIDGADEDEDICSKMRCLRRGCVAGFRYDARSEKCVPRNNCAENEALCGRPNSGHECVGGRSGGYGCKCARDFYNWDNRTCLEGHDKVIGWLLFVVNGSVYLQDLERGQRPIVLYNNYSPDEVIKGDSPVAYDFRKNYVVWAVNFAGRSSIYIGKLFVDKPSPVAKADSPTLLAKRNRTHSDLAIDHNSDVIYAASDFFIEAINVTSPHESWLVFNGTYRREEVVNFSRISNLIIYHEERQLLWLWSMFSFAESNPSIYTRFANLDGSSVTDHGRVGGQFAIDSEGNNTFALGEANSDEWLLINSVNFNAGGGSLSQKSINITVHRADPKLSVFQILGEQILFGTNHTLYTLDKHGVDPRPKPIAKLAHRHLKYTFVHPSLQPMVRSPCEKFNCHGICLSSKSNATCYNSVDPIETNSNNAPVKKQFVDRRWENYGFSSPSVIS